LGLPKQPVPPKLAQPVRLRPGPLKAGQRGQQTLQPRAAVKPLRLAKAKARAQVLLK
jgi:hypothetical protein